MSQTAAIPAGDPRHSPRPGRVRRRRAASTAPARTGPSRWVTGAALVAVADSENWRKVDVHDGAALALAPDATPTGFVSGGDDGKFRRIGIDGAVSDIADFRIEMGRACREPSR